MRDAIVHVKAFPTETSEGYLWDVSCVDCDESIGTMHSQTLQKAILATANRGGVKCPSCREVSCESCGDNVLLSRGETPTIYNVGVWPKPMKLCWICVQEIEQRGSPAVVDKLETKNLREKHGVWWQF